MSIWNIRVFPRIFATHMTSWTQKEDQKIQERKACQKSRSLLLILFRLPKLTPKPLAEGIGAYGLLMFQKLRGPFTKLMLATRLSHWSPRFCFFFRRSKFGSFPWGSWLGVFEMVGSLGVVGSSVSEWFPWLRFSSSTDRCLTETAVSFFRRIFPWTKIQFMAMDSFFLVHRLRCLESSTLLGWKAWFSVWELLLEIQCKTPPGMYTTFGRENKHTKTFPFKSSDSHCFLHVSIGKTCPSHFQKR